MKPVTSDAAAALTPMLERSSCGADPVASSAEAGHIPSPTSHSEGRVAASDSVKVEARDLVDKLPENASWEDLMYQVYVREAIDAGVRDVEAGRVVSHEEAVRRLRAPR